MVHGDQKQAHDVRLSSRFSIEDIEILDAGLGTTLEDIIHKDISHPLWSAHLIESDPESIVAAHLAFLKAGSSIILTATYQCATETFSRAGYSAKRGEIIMHKAVALAVRARGEYLETQPPTAPVPKIALSLGPYGATLSPAAEFTGIYPPPYGPAHPVTFFPGSQPRLNTQEEREAEDALVQFHFERLHTMASSKETWDTIDMIAFETIPLLREARAIRRAMTLLRETSSSIRHPPWWISFNFPDGALPETNTKGINYSAADAFKACFEQHETTSIIPSAFGINCTQVKHLEKCVSLASKALQDVGDYWFTDGQNIPYSHPLVQKPGPSLVLYPNGGRIYDATTMSWCPASPKPSGLTDLSEPQIWAIGLVEAVLQGVPTNANVDWSGLVIGGCCKTEPEHISALLNLI